MMSQLPHRRWAVVHASDRYISVSPASGHRFGVPDPQGEVVFLARDAADAEVGSAVLKALAQSRFLDPDQGLEPITPAEEAAATLAWVDEVIARYGYAHEQEVRDVSRLCEVACDEHGAIWATPVRDRDEMGLEFLHDQFLGVLDVEEPEGIGSGLANALRISWRAPAADAWLGADARSTRERWLKALEFEHMPPRSRLPPGAGTWDFFVSLTGRAVCIRAADLSEYRTPGRLYATLKRYVDAAAAYRERPDADVDVPHEAITSKEIRLAIPEYRSAIELLQVELAVGYGLARNVRLVATPLQGRRSDEPWQPDLRERPPAAQPTGLAAMWRPIADAWRGARDNQADRSDAAKPPPVRRWAIVHASDRYISISPQSGYAYGVQELAGKAVFLARDAPDELVGQVLEQALAQSRFLDARLGIQDIGPGEEAQADVAWIEQVAARYGYEHAQEAREATRFCEVSLENGLISILPVAEVEEAEPLMLLDQLVKVSSGAGAGRAGAAVKLAIDRAFQLAPAMARPGAGAWLARALFGQRKIYPKAAYLTAKRYIDAAAEYVNRPGVEVDAPAELIRSKEIQLAVRGRQTSAHRQQLDRAVAYGKAKGVDFVVTSVD